ncbi:MAG: hypothetical protein HGN29_17435 [Asgard group archaeon]|nr:hypothetical protein [Asgard group archaeon]
MKKRILSILLLVTIMITQISFMPSTVGLAENVNAMSQQIDTSIKLILVDLFFILYSLKFIAKRKCSQTYS